ncbi:MAG: tetratricopeptide repeat protein, partial [Bdellovibrionales bacterium]|nr:tetratricopeptide repeat protein [Bdellovibrionales bacterium]
EEVRKPDAFIHYTDKAIAWIEAHGKTIAVLIAIFVLAGGSYVGFIKYKKNQEKTAQAALYSLRTQLEKLNESYNKDTAQAAKDVIDDKAADTVKKDFESHYATIIKDLQDFTQKYTGTYSEKAGYIQLAYLFATNKKWDKVIETLQGTVSKTPKNNFYFGLMSMMLSQALMNTNNFSEAIKVLEQVSAQPEHQYLHAESLLRIGLCYEKQNDMEKAKQYLERVERDFADSEAATNAKYYLRMFKVKGNA